MNLDLENPTNAIEDAPEDGGMPASANLHRYCLLRFAGRLWGISSDFSKGIVTVDSMIRVPGAPHYLAGVHYRRGRILPILDLAIPFALPPSQVTLPATALELAAAGCEAALLCDAVVGFELADASQLSTLEVEFESGQSWLVGELVFRQGRAAVIDIAGLIAALKITAHERTTEALPQDPSFQAPATDRVESDHQPSKEREE